MKTLHIKYKNLLHIHPINNSLYITMSAKVKVSPCTSQAAGIHCGGRQKLPPGAACSHSAIATRSTRSPFSSLFLLSKYTRKRWQGKAVGVGGSLPHCAGKLDHRQAHRQLEIGHKHERNCCS